METVWVLTEIEYKGNAADRDIVCGCVPSVKSKLFPSYAKARAYTEMIYNRIVSKFGGKGYLGDMESSFTYEGITSFYQWRAVIEEISL